MKKLETCIFFLLLSVSIFPAFGQNATLSGSIETPNGDPVSSVEVQLFDNNGTLISSQTTSGQYTFNNLTQGTTYQLEFSKDISPLNGVSTFDMVLVARHILGITALSSFEKELAADVNISGTITTLDIVLTRRLILNIDQEFPVLPSWRFIAANNTPGTDNTVTVSINNANTVQNITGIKLGDVNNSVVP